MQPPTAGPTGHGEGARPTLASLTERLIAAMRGLRVITAAGDDDEKLARELGAAAFVPRSADLATAVRDLVPGTADTAFDAAVLGYPLEEAARRNQPHQDGLGPVPIPRRVSRPAKTRPRSARGRVPGCGR